MIYPRPSPAATIIIGVLVTAYQAGEHLRYVEPSAPGQVITSVMGGGSVSIGTALINYPTTFAKVEPSPPIVPPNQKFEQT
jgi:hypothetical protein